MKILSTFPISAKVVGFIAMHPPSCPLAKHQGRPDVGGLFDGKDTISKRELEISVIWYVIFVRR